MSQTLLQPQHLTPADWLRYAVALMVAGIGGWGFYVLGLPVAWLSGGLVATTLLALAGFNARTPEPARIVVFLIIGIQIGTSVNDDTLAGLRLWPVSLGLLALTVVLVTVAGALLLTKAFAWSRASALMASVPGALSLTLAATEDLRADVTKVVVVQCMRVFFLMALLPGLLQWLLPHDHASTIAQQNTADVTSLIIIISAGGVGGLLAQWLKLPAGLIIGAAIAVLAVHLSGLSHGVLPQWLLMPVFSALGALIGLRFAGISMGDLRSLAWQGLASFGLALIVAAFMAVVVAKITGFPIALMLLAYAPGGLDAMVIMAFALNLDPVFIAGHQIARYLMLSFGLPMLLIWLKRES